MSDSALIQEVAELKRQLSAALAEVEEMREALEALIKHTDSRLVPCECEPGSGCARADARAALRPAPRSDGYGKPMGCPDKGPGGEGKPAPSSKEG